MESSKYPLFTKETVKHYHKEILPILEDIFGIGEIGGFNINLWVENIQAAAVNDSHLKIDGLSADLGVFFVMASAVLGIEIPQDIIFSGAVSGGNVLPAASLDVKLDTAASAGAKRFYCARPDTKDPLAGIDSDELAAADDAIRKHRQSRVMQIQCVSNIFEVFDDIFDDFDILPASFNTGVFDKDIAVELVSPAAMIAEKICAMDRAKLRNTLSSLTLANKFEHVYFLWERFLTFYIDQNRYPAGCGNLFYEWICAVPFKIRKKIKTPFVPMEFFGRLSELAGKENLQDLGLFFDCIRGRYNLRSEKTLKAGDNNGKVKDDRDVFDSVASVITAEYLDKNFGIKIDSARASFILPSSIVESYGEFTELVESFFNHLCSFTSLKPGIKNAGDPAGVYALIERAFANKGGFAEARCRAFDGSGGGLRSVLDELTAQFKRDIYTDHVNAAFKRAIDIKDDNQKKAFARGALAYLKPFLPAQLADRPAESMLSRTEVLARIYVKAIDTIKYNLRRL